MDDVIVDEDSELLIRLRAGDEEAFMTLVDKYGPLMLRIALSHVRTRAVAEEVVQEAWLGVLQGLGRFEGRSSLKTWIYRILMNTAKTRAQREARSIPFSAAAGGDEPSVDPERFLGPGQRRPGGWSLGPSEWPTPEEELLSGETREVIMRAIDELPESQRAVITMRDVEGLPSDEVAAALEITEGNQRVLLHRARAKVRRAIEGHLGAVEPTGAP
jgi:RNA polymerase sigma-70 factor (ECF subfamily)